MKKVLITGGAGFLGSNFCKKLIDSCYIYCLDSLSSGNKENIKPFLDNKNFEFIEHDIINPIDIQVDEIYNLACPASPIHYQKNPIQTFKTSVFGIYNLLELAKKYNAKITLTDIKTPFISSTMVRDGLKNKEDVSDLIDEKVIKYIKDNNLYD